MDCKFIKKDKSECNAKAIRCEDYCFFHSEKQKEAREEATSRGGQNPKRNYIVNDSFKLNTPQEIRELIGKTIKNMNQSKISVNMANATGYLANIALKTIEQGDYQKRLEVIEYALEIGNQTNKTN